ncbi:MAG TPA: sulfatase [Planctomycetota bacterium]|jgi:arylsulfatase A-like enzyme|nr:sulfatase [Planctomycetota bacterium]
MTKRHTNATLSALLLLPLLACGQAPSVQPPSVILISLDTLRARHMSIYGYERETTPELEKFAEQAVVYDTAISSSCWTLTSHASMLSGFYPEQHGVTEKRRGFSPEVPMIAERLYDRGYQTLSLFYEGWIHERFGMNSGFDVWRSHMDALEAEEHLREEFANVSHNRPYFLFLHLFDIHAERLEEPDDPFYDPPPPFDTMFMADAREQLEGINFDQVREDRDNPVPEDIIPPLTALYDGNIAWIDSLLGKWFRELDELGFMENTLVVITADHGESLASRGSLKGHGGLYQEGLHVPLLVRYPDGTPGAPAPGTHVTEMVHQVDIAPTILAGLGMEPAPELPGYSLLGQRPPDRVVRSSKPPHYARFQWPHKIFGGEHTRRLFDLVEDPGERNGISRAFEQAQAMEDAFQEEFKDRPWMEWEPIRVKPAAKKTEDMLKALGYAGEVDGD